MIFEIGIVDDDKFRIYTLKPRSNGRSLCRCFFRDAPTPRRFRSRRSASTTRENARWRPPCDRRTIVDDDNPDRSNECCGVFQDAQPSRARLNQKLLVVSRYDHRERRARTVPLRTSVLRIKRHPGQRILVMLPPLRYWSLRSCSASVSCKWPGACCC